MNDAQDRGIPGAHMRRVTHSTEETISLGTEIASMLRAGDIVLLVGEMGAGKTYLAKGIVSGLGAGDINEVNSPAYDVVHEFMGAVPVSHYDLFKFNNMSPDDIEWLLESFQNDGVHIVEWGNRIADVLDRPVVYLTLEPGDGQDERIIEFRRVSAEAGKRTLQ